MENGIFFSLKDAKSLISLSEEETSFIFDQKRIELPGNTTPFECIKLINSKQLSPEENSLMIKVLNSKKLTFGENLAFEKILSGKELSKFTKFIIQYSYVLLPVSMYLFLHLVSLTSPLLALTLAVLAILVWIAQNEKLKRNNNGNQ